MTMLTEQAREVRNQYQRDYYQNNRDKLLKMQREWRKNNPDKVREYNKRYWENKKVRGV